MSNFFIRYDASEAFAAFLFTLGALFIYTIIKRKSFGLNNKVKTRTFASLSVFALVMISMFAGLAISNTVSGDISHGWGNPTFAISLAMVQIQHVFRDTQAMIVGISYVGFQILAAIIAGIFFIIIIKINNAVAEEKEHKINLKKVFKFNKFTNKSMIREAGKNHLAVIFLVFAFLGASYLGQTPSAFPVTPNSLMPLITQSLIAGLAIAFAVALFGSTTLMAINPATWVATFMVKFAAQRKISGRELLSELISPLAVALTAIEAGAISYGFLNLPTTV